MDKNKINKKTKKVAGMINILIPEDFYTKEIAVNLTQQDIEVIIDELERTEHNIFVFLGYDKIINKLKGGQNG